MGKKHKKHKLEKHSFEDALPDKPLKLVLKVSGTEVTELSTSSPGHDMREASDHDRHRDKKKKKKKKGDKERGSPVAFGDEGKKKMSKKRKGQDSIDTDWEEQEFVPAHTHPEVMHDPSLSKKEEKEQTPLQEALSQLIRQLQRKDPCAFFSFPVTDLIAPGYSVIIKNPMDFSTMKDKVKKEYYQCLEELKEDFKIMCENAMVYNKPDTIYYKAAKKMLHSGMKILSQERLQSLKQSIEFMADLENSNNSQSETDKEGEGIEGSRDGTDAMDTSNMALSPQRIMKDVSRQDSKDEAFRSGSQTEKELEEVRKLIQDSGGKLSNRNLDSELQFMRRKSDGTTTLGILNPTEPSAGDAGFCPVKLGMMTSRLQTGINTLYGFKEDKRNRVTPVSYVNYGPFASYAPIYDSSFANISKEDSDLIYTFYGEESSLHVSDSISEFLSRTEEYMTKVADNILDVLTSGEHSKALQGEETASNDEAEPPELTEAAGDVEAADGALSRRSSLTSLSCLSGQELETSAFSSEEARSFQQKLDETTVLLKELQEVQNERLSIRPPPNGICLMAPNVRELQLAERVTGNLSQLASQVAPGDISSVHGIRKAMGIKFPREIPEEAMLDFGSASNTPEPVDVFLGTEESAAVTV